MSEEQQLLPLRGESALTNKSAVCAKKMMQCVGVVAFMLIVASYVAYAKYNQKWMTKVVFVETTVQSVLLCTYLCCGKNKKCIQALWSCIAAGFFILMGMLKFDRVRAVLFVHLHWLLLSHVSAGSTGTNHANIAGKSGFTVWMNKF